MCNAATDTTSPFHLLYFPIVRRTLGKKSDFDEITEALNNSASKDSNKQSDV